MGEAGRRSAGGNRLSTFMSLKSFLREIAQQCLHSAPGVGNGEKICDSASLSHTHSYFFSQHLLKSFITSSEVDLNHENIPIWDFTATTELRELIKIVIKSGFDECIAALIDSFFIPQNLCKPGRGFTILKVVKVDCVPCLDSFSIEFNLILGAKAKIHPLCQLYKTSSSCIEKKCWKILKNERFVID